MLTLVGGDAAHGPVRSFSRALDDLYSGNTARSPDVVAERLATKAKAAVEALSPFVIRHGIDDLPHEQKSFGCRADWNIDVPLARPDELELLMRMDRALRVAKDDGFESSRATNDPRFHVGWRHLDSVREGLKSKVPQFAEPARAVVEHQLQAIKGLRAKVGVHSKMAAVVAEVKTTIEQEAKVVLFCHHIATAQELTAHLDSALPGIVPVSSPAPSAWSRAWDEVLEPAGEERHEESLRATFIEWLCTDLIRTQTWGWLQAASPSRANLAGALETMTARRAHGPETIAQAAQRLYHALIQSKSSRAVLRAATDRLDLLPGANGTARVLGVCPPSENEVEESLFLHNQQPDTVISIFNSPFGPDVLVVTDKLSEGIDLHRYCRHLIHYELDPSPIRTVQRNGRLRRVNSWAAATGQPIRYAYPAFCGTRDHRLVQIMKKRIDSFSLLLGGVQDFDVEEVVGSDEAWRNQVIVLAKSRLASAGGQLRAKVP
jgi:hypothetical protein